MRKFTIKNLTVLLLLQWFGLGFCFAQDKDDDFIFYLFEADAQIHEREMYQPDHNINFAEMQLLERENGYNWDYSSRPTGFLAMAKKRTHGLPGFLSRAGKRAQS